jgi:hypothetical protein
MFIKMISISHKKQTFCLIPQARKKALSVDIFANETAIFNLFKIHDNLIKGTV